LKIAIPDALFKIVIKESGNQSRPDVLAFIYPQTGRGYRRGPFDHTKYLKSVAEIEKRTGLVFLTTLPLSDQRALKLSAQRTLWN
jgi:DNA/RNA endonuclease G (NUC1)